MINYHYRKIEIGSTQKKTFFVKNWVNSINNPPLLSKTIFNNFAYRNKATFIMVRVVFVIRMFSTLSDTVNKLFTDGCQK